ncbi:MAG: PTS system mannose/fructose/sorbose family transporter subunit IID [Candidatus Methylomirabilia bacterium]
MAVRLGWRIFLRSLLVQSSWNFSGLQNLGFFYMTWPALSRRRLPAAEIERVGVRHLGNFNTHPYFAGLVAATVIRHEECGGTDEAVEGLKRSLMCALGAVGDEFFWATLRPFSAVLALPAALAGNVWAPLLMLAVYNVPHFSVRVWGIRAGLEQGCGVVEMLQRLPLARVQPALGAATAVLVGFLVGAAAFDRTWGLLPGHGLASVGVSVSVFLLLLAIQSWGLGQGRMLACLSALAALAGVVQVVSAP